MVLSVHTLQSVCLLETVQSFKLTSVQCEELEDIILCLQPAVFTIILVLWPFSFTVIELSALLNDITGSFVKACPYVANFVTALLWRSVSLPVLVEIGLGSLQQKTFCRWPTSLQPLHLQLIAPHSFALWPFFPPRT